MSQLWFSLPACIRACSGTVNNHGCRILGLQPTTFLYHRIHSNFLSSSASGYDSGSTTDDEGARRATSKKFNLNSEALGKILGMPRPAILKLMSKKPAIRSVNPDHLFGTNNAFRAHGFEPEEMMQYPELFMMTPNAVENYILIFKETLFKDIRPHYVLNYRELTKKPIRVLKDAGLIPSDLNVIQQYCDELEMDKDFEKSVIAKLPEGYEQLMPLADVRIEVLKRYLMTGLKCDKEAADKIIKTYPRFRNRSYHWVKQNFQIVVENLNLPLEKVLKHSYLLLANPVNSLEILKKLPVLGGRPIGEVISLRPKVFSCPVSSLQEISRLFDQHGITTKAISKYPEVFTLSPATVKARLEEFQKVPEFEVLKNHPRVGRLIYYQNKIKKRLEYLQTTHQVYNSSLHILSTDTEHFEIFLKHGEMRPKGDDNVQFVSTYLNLPKPDVRKLLMVQPHWRDISPVSIKSVLNHLTRTKSFTVGQLKHALPVVLYPLDKVMANVRLVQESKEATETDLYFLQMVLYFMERKGHFSGAGVWNNERQPLPPAEHAPEVALSASASTTTASLNFQAINDASNYTSKPNLVKSRTIDIDDHITSFDDVDPDDAPSAPIAEFSAHNKLDFDRIEKLDLMDDEDFDFDEDAIVVSKYAHANANAKSHHSHHQRPNIDDLALHRLV